MKHLIFLVFTFLLLLGCQKERITFQDQLALDIAEIEAFLDSLNIDAVRDDSGVFYVIEEEGTGTNFPTVTSQVSMAYTGTLLDGTVFDSANTTNPLKSPLGNLITGWQIGVPKFKKEGKGTLYIPSGYAYGTAERSTIPANSILIFDIELLDFN